MAGKEVDVMSKDALDLFVMVVQSAVPYAVVFAVGQRIVTMFLGMAFKGEIRL